MERGSHDHKRTPRTAAILHSIKMWLVAPVGLQRHARLENVKNAHNKDAIPEVRGTAALVLHVCWFAILLGIAVQISLLTASVAFGRVPKLNPLIVDFAQRIAWSTIVCGSISVALAASKLPVSFMGLAGMLSASVAFKIARSVQKGVAAALGVAPASAKGPLPLVLGIIKAVEYGCLAAVIAWLVKRKQRGAVVHASMGLAIGVFFGSIILGYTYWTNAKLFSVADAVSRGLNELLFPVGCSLVLFATEVWGKQWKSAPEHKAQQTLPEGAASTP
jgi:hypothetical protein